ncbi:MAG TPA: glutathione S-transferase family protein [Aestuariivirgaceae bacterium]|nr:glutathione S-transferase family protein [Aestuariivirgaceae bacterium]
MGVEFASKMAGPTISAIAAFAGLIYEQAASQQQARQAFMMLIGRLLSPFVRRTAVLLDLLELPFELREISTINEQDKVRQYSPGGRLPALITDEGTLIDSFAIALTLLDRHDPDERLWPRTGAPLAEALQVVFLANSALEKAIAAIYERTRRPEEFLYQPWIDLCESQSEGAIEALESRIDGEFCVGDRLTYADIVLATGLTFLTKLEASSFSPERHLRLEALRDRCEALPAFAARLPG